MSTPPIEIRDVSFAFNGKSVLQNINLTVDPGEFMAVIGPNGGGKTTLIKLVLGLLKPNSGTIRVLGKPPGANSHRIGYVPQNTHIQQRFPVSVLDVVLMGRIHPGTRCFGHSREDRARASDALARMEMGA